MQRKILRHDELVWESSSESPIPNVNPKINEGDYIVYKDGDEQKIGKVLCAIEPRYKMMNGDWVAHSDLIRYCEQNEIPKTVL